MTRNSFVITRMMNLSQMLGAYFEDDCGDELTNEPTLAAILAKKVLVSQPTLSRFFNHMDEDTLDQFYDLMGHFRKEVYSVKKPEIILLDLEFTFLIHTDIRKGDGFNFLCQNHGYYLIVYDVKYW